MQKLQDVMDKLLGENGCPWDREQTHETLTRHVIEETYEVVEAIQEGDMDKLREELGDLLFQVVFHAALAEREGHFNLDDVIHTISEKMINRHPHVFGDMDLKTSDDVMEKWEGFKKQEGKKHLLEGIPKFLPALLRSLKMQEKAAQVGFDWPEVDGAIDKFKEEVEEFKAASTEENLKEEIGDMFFALANIARIRNIDPEEALQLSNDKFARRFNYIEEKVKSNSLEFTDYKLEELDNIWDEAKLKGL
ncbi:MAG TPA: nucleoside triphosphate pyrophosphohydrolase [Syntrophomonadaceae bacterium]|nr:nucleoside triphosphate pyrophosphohydrolase [Syntrophomonadaceae bacterium]